MILNLDLIKVSKITHNFDLSKVLKMSSLRINFKNSEELKEIATLLAKKEILRAIKACLKMKY